ncbi:ABC transporter substrate-binding protein [Fictibacillus aquaticus]|uniref:ABC transporter substrate-binding protein n=1 Tax=Fictibacillus aquaticus TaxID=2021314 RepID=A0A235F9P2_9BACL|nr:ABC transporter substrate-binding protein [Fictibacillus aquaticus]OYD57677.1 ABC transporter substrate-binding protein [Fictibacillus aquaticus]
MDKNLLALWRHFPSGSIKIETAAETLELSTKQTTRHLQRWSAEGWLKYTAGRGRGNASQLEWHKEVEQIYEEQMLKMLDEEPVEHASKYLLYDWSDACRLRLMNKFHTKFGYIQQSDDRLIVPRRRPFITTHPVEATDAHSARIVANVYNRLITMTETDAILPEIAHSWEVTPTRLRLYLKKDIAFHDGSILTSNDVVNCLEKLRVHHFYRDIWSPVEAITAPAPLVVDIHFPSGCSYCLHILGSFNCSIYKENNGQLLGTGAFHISENNEKKTTLTAFSDYFQERPLLDAVEFVQVPETFDMIYHSALEEEKHSTFQVESSSGFGVVIMNIFRDSDIQRKEIRDYIHAIIAKNRHTIGTFEPRASASDRICRNSEPCSLPEVTRPIFTKPIVIRTTEHTKSTTDWLIECLEKEGVPVEVLSLTFRESLTRRGANLQADLFIHGEIFELNEEFSFYNFVKNGYSPLKMIVNSEQSIGKILDSYTTTPFEAWPALNAELEKLLAQESIMIPIYSEKRQIPFSSELMNVQIKHFGYVDFSKLWVRPVVN